MERVQASDALGKTYNRLTVIEILSPKVYKSGNKSRVVAKCECGNVKEYLLGAIISGNTKSCGCMNAERIYKHGMYQSRQYQIWADMKNRCDNTENESYQSYGGRGIEYSAKWKTFEGFWEDMMEGYSDSLTLERIDVNGNYCKENCTWISKKKQTRNRRRYATNSTGVAGVRVSRGPDGEITHYIASSQNLDGKAISKWFSVSKFGSEEAFRLACEFREETIRFLNEMGAGYAKSHGS